MFYLFWLKKGDGPVGRFAFSLNVDGKGLARMNDNTQFEFFLTATSLNPKTGGVGGIVIN